MGGSQARTEFHCDDLANKYDPLGVTRYGLIPSEGSSWLPERASVGVQLPVARNRATRLHFDPDLQRGVLDDPFANQAQIAPGLDR